MKQTLTAALEAAKARSPQPPPSEVSDDSGAAAPALVIDVGSPRKRDRSRGRAPTVDARNAVEYGIGRGPDGRDQAVRILVPSRPTIYGAPSGASTGAAAANVIGVQAASLQQSERERDR